MAVLVSNSITPAFNFFDADKNELNEIGANRTIFTLNAKRSYKVLVSDFPNNKDWHIFVDEEEVFGHGCVTLGDCICWCEGLDEQKHPKSYHTEIIRRLISVQNEAADWYRKYTELKEKTDEKL